MQSIVLRTLLILAAFAMVPDAFAADNGGGDVFVDAAYGRTTGGQSSTGDTGFTHGPQSAWRAGGGYRWRLDDAKSLGVEVGYMHFGIIEDNSDANEFWSADTVATAITAGADYHYLFGDDRVWIFQGRAGLMSVKLRTDYSSFIPQQQAFSGSSVSRQLGVYFGAGIGRDITRDLSFILAFEVYGSERSGDRSSGVNLSQGFLGLAAEYRFGD